MDFQEISRSWILAYLRVFRLRKQSSKFQSFGLSAKKVFETQKCTQADWHPPPLPLFCWQLWGVITFETFEQFIVCPEIFRIILSDIYLSSRKVSSESEMGHVHIPTLKCPFDMEWPFWSYDNLLFFYKWLATNPGNGNTPVWVRPISGDWGELGIPNLAQISLIKFHWYFIHSGELSFGRVSFPVKINPSLTTIFGSPDTCVNVVILSLERE